MEVLADELPEKPLRTSPRRQSGEQMDEPPKNTDSPPAHGTRSNGSPGSSPAPSEASSLDPLAMSPVHSRPRRNSRSGASRLSVASNAPPPVAKPKKRVGAGLLSEKLPISSMSAAALGKLTTSNTKRNEVPVAEVDRRLILLDIARPPSPSSKIRTLAQRESDEAELARQRRARNRSIMRGEVVPEESPQRPVKHPRAPGDDEEYHTPKKIRLAMEGSKENDSGDRISDSVPLLGEAEAEHRSKGKNKRSQTASSNSTSPPPHSKAKKYVRWNKALTHEAPKSGERPESSSSGSGSGSGGRSTRSALAKDPTVSPSSILNSPIPNMIVCLGLRARLLRKSGCCVSTFRGPQERPRHCDKGRLYR